MCIECPLLALLTLVAAGTGRAVDWAPDEAAACAARGRVRVRTVLGSC